MSYEKFDVSLLGRGDATKQINHWVTEAIKDCMDPNKDREAVRKVTLEIKIQAAQDAETAAVNFRVIPKFPADCAGQDIVAIQRSTGTPYINTDTQIPLGFDEETGEVDGFLERVKRNVTKAIGDEK